MTTWKALSVKQPWASALMSTDDATRKDVENRSWTTPVRGSILIHASQNPDWNAPAWGWEAAGLPVPPADGKFVKKHFAVGIPTSVILGPVFLHDIVQDSDSRWASAGQNHWLTSDPAPWAEPVPANGDLGLWDWERP